MVVPPRELSSRRRWIVGFALAAVLATAVAVLVPGARVSRATSPSQAARADSALVERSLPPELAPDAEPPPLDAPAQDRTETLAGTIVSGRVRDVHGAEARGVLIEAWRPIAAATAPDDSQPAASTRADTTGRYSLALEEGVYLISYGDGRFDVPRLGQTHVGSAPLQLDLQLPDVASLDVTVRGEDGRIAPNTDILVEHDRMGARPWRTNDSGRVSARHIPTGTYHFVANVPSVGRGDVVFELEPGAKARFELMLRSVAMR